MLAFALLPLFTQAGRLGGGGGWVHYILLGMFVCVYTTGQDLGVDRSYLWAGGGGWGSTADFLSPSHAASEAASNSYMTLRVESFFL